MNIDSGYFANPRSHHDGWFRVFRSKRTLEVWFGHRWIVVDRNKP